MADRREAALVAVTVLPLGLVPLLTPPAGQPAGKVLAWLLFLAAPGHLAATSALPAAWSRRSLGLLAGCVGAGLAAAEAGVLQPVLVAVFGWQLWHFQKQNLGLVALAGPRATPGQRRALELAAAAGILALLAHPSAAALHEPALPLLPVAWGVWLAASLLVAASRPGPMLLAATAFPLPLLLTSSAYASMGAMALAHGLQYALVARSRQHPAVLAAVMLAGAAVLLTASGERLGFGCYVGVLAAHMLVDAKIWRTPRLVRQPIQ